MTLKIQNLDKIYQNSNHALKDLNLIIPNGKIFGVLGPNGAGKSTLLKIIANFIPSNNGKIFYYDENILKNKNWIKNNVRYCPQEPVFYDYLTVEENLYLIADLYDIPKEEQKSLIKQQLIKLNLYHKKKDSCKHISGGQKKRLSLMMTFLTNPKIVLLDEPSAGLDIDGREILLELLLEFKREDLIILISTHDFDDAQKLCDSIAILDKGELLISGDSNTLIQEKLEEKFILSIKTKNFQKILNYMNENFKKLHKILSIDKIDEENLINLKIDGNFENIKNLNNDLLDLDLDFTQISYRPTNLEDLYHHLINQNL